jgi:hypothetical protein
MHAIPPPEAGWQMNAARSSAFAAGTVRRKFICAHLKSFLSVSAPVPPKFLP